MARQVGGQTAQGAVLEDAHGAGRTAGHLGDLLGAEVAEHPQQHDLRLRPGQAGDPCQRAIALDAFGTLRGCPVERAIARRMEADLPAPPAPVLVERPPPGRREDQPPQRRLVALELRSATDDLDLDLRGDVLGDVRPRNGPDVADHVGLELGEARLDQLGELGRPV